MNNENHPDLYHISLFGITHMQQHNPLMVAWWSAVFPGFGHYLLNQYIRAALLTLSEVTINTLAHINEAMIYSFCGQFEQAKSVIEPRWAFGYLVIYLISIWDSYRSAVYQNKLYHLTKLKNVTLPRIGVFSSEIQYLERKKPIVGVLYSFFFPGLGQLYIHRFGLAFYAIFWWWVYLTLSGLHESLLTLILGDIHKSTIILNPHWLLFMPSVMGGSIYHAYITGVEHNKLYCLSQRMELTKRYGSNKLRLFP
ncbi:hypothetical protein [Neobacillus niacini]|jgi:hypothetical protein|uniref:hypothetical protein n=1 Tax=Neobacillus niacini TaxID=86668 RepID=UPI001C8D7779|nr:hypothetical protein [Neobacillus niacini]MBY0146248.1 hypothetical protein [Neobacillus niacini]